jgi:hypothetical protein
MSIAVLRKKTKFKSRATANRTDYNYIGQPKGLAYRGFMLNMSNRGSVTGRKFNNGKTTGLAASCGQCNTLAAANERQSNCASCNKSAVAKQVSYRNYLRRATEAVSKGKGTGLRAKVTAGETKSTWKRGPSFGSSSHIDNKKSAVIQCTQPVGSVAVDCSYPNEIKEPKRNTCSVTLGKTSYTRMYNIPCNTTKKVLGVTAGDQIARVKARRVCKASGINSTGSQKPCSESYEYPMMHDNQRRVC